MRGCIPLNERLPVRWRRCWALPRRGRANGFAEPRRPLRERPWISVAGSLSWSGRTVSCDERTDVAISSATPSVVDRDGELDGHAEVA